MQPSHYLYKRHHSFSTNPTCKLWLPQQQISRKETRKWNWLFFHPLNKVLNNLSAHLLSPASRTFTFSVSYRFTLPIVHWITKKHKNSSHNFFFDSSVTGLSQFSIYAVDSTVDAYRDGEIKIGPIHQTTSSWRLGSTSFRIASCPERLDTKSMTFFCASSQRRIADILILSTGAHILILLSLNLLSKNLFCYSSFSPYNIFKNHCCNH